MRLMSNEQIDPRWPRLLSLAVHEFRTPITVVAGYLRMVLKERVGPISDQQRKLLEEAEKSCGRLSALVAEMSDLSALESGNAPLNRAGLDFSRVLQEAVDGLPELPEREVPVVLEGADSPISMDGDATRLRGSMAAVLAALRREVVTSDRLIARVTKGNGAMCLIAIADAEQIDAVQPADTSSLERFDEWRGGSGLSLALARRVIGQHGGAVFAAPGDQKAGAIILLPCR